MDVGIYKRSSLDVNLVQKKKKSKKHKRDHSSCSSDSNHEERRHKHKKRKHKRSSSSDDDKKRHKKHKSKKKKSKSSRNSDKEVKEGSKVTAENTGASTDNVIGPSLSEAQKVKGPMTKEEWEKQQSIVRRVYDPETGRNRLVKGDGEILEEIVSKEQHRKINKEATFHDGEYFKKQLGLQ